MCSSGLQSFFWARNELCQRIQWADEQRKTLFFNKCFESCHCLSRLNSVSCILSSLHLCFYVLRSFFLFKGCLSSPPLLHACSLWGIALHTIQVNICHRHMLIQEGQILQMQWLNVISWFSLVSKLLTNLIVWSDWIVSLKCIGMMYCEMALYK